LERLVGGKSHKSGLEALKKETNLELEHIVDNKTVTELAATPERL